VDDDRQRYSRRAVVLGAGGIGAAAVVGGAVWVRRGDDPDTVADASPTAAYVPPTPAPTADARKLIQRADAAFERRAFADGETIPWRHGIFVMATTTGAIDAVRLARPDNDAARPVGGSYTGSMVSAYGVSADGRFTWTQDDGGHIGGLYDREQRRAWTWPLGRVQVRGADAVLGIPMRWRLGYHQAFGAGREASKAFGHYGYGGSGGWADPEIGMSVGFVTNRIGSLTTPLGDLNLFRLNRVVRQCYAQWR
jgi:CubicO group peptidase (beta-lactamase class C family)